MVSMICMVRSLLFAMHLVEMTFPQENDSPCNNNNNNNKHPLPAPARAPFFHAHPIRKSL